MAELKTTEPLLSVYILYFLFFVVAAVAALEELKATTAETLKTSSTTVTQGLKLTGAFTYYIHTYYTEKPLRPPPL